MNWDRQYRILAGQAGGAGFEIGEPVDGKALHVNFSLEKSDNQATNTGKLKISNLSDEHKAILKEKGCVVEIRAGYRDHIAPIFLGGVSQTTEELNNADRDIEVELIDGYLMYDRVGSISLNEEVTGTMVLDEIVNGMGFESAIVTDAAAALLEQSIYENGYAFIGKLKTALQKCCDKANVTFTLQNGILQVFELGESVSQQAFIISAQTGLISIPKKVTISEKGTKSTKKKKAAAGTGTSTTEGGITGYEIDFFINGAIGINDMIRLESRTLTGFYRVKKLKYKGDNYNGDWKCTAQIIEVTG